MFKFNCPSCHGEIEAEDEMAGQLADCPYCGNSVEVKRPVKPALRKAGGAPHYNQNIPHGKPKTSGVSFWLGFLLSLFGLLIAAIIEGKEGALKALYGMLWAIIVGVAIWVIGAVMLHFA